MSEELKPCPFCGSDPIRVINPFGILYAVKCLECGAEGSYMKTVEQAIEAWNTRVDTEPRIVPVANITLKADDLLDRMTGEYFAQCPNCGEDMYLERKEEGEQ